MGYLLPAEYVEFGLTAETADAWVTAASAMMEAYCRRPTLLAASYTERMRVPREAQTVRLSYTPLVSVDAVQARYARPERGERLGGEFAFLSSFAAAFALPGQWVTVDPSTLEVSLPTGEFRFAWNVMGLRYGEAEVTYIWPGDVLAVSSGGVTTSLLVRSVVVTDGGAEPEVLRYAITFANDWATEWADGLGVKLSEEIAADAVLPQTASSAGGQVLANLQQLAVTSLTETALQVDIGTVLPAGWGVEVRRRDGAFGWGVDAADLVLRSPVRSFAIPRAAQVEQFYVRIYDASSPPLYSRFSSAVFVNWPVG